ncbi:peptidoglycan DD-metalloendopeptidase family protein [Propionibacteriaceae bacterium Y2011]
MNPHHATRAERAPIARRRGRTTLVRHIVTAALALAMAVLLSPALTAPARAAATATVATDGMNLNVRSGPGTSHEVVGSLAPGTRVTIQCTAQGTAVTGPWGSTTLWDKLSDGTWASDAWLYTGTNDAVAPACDGDTTPPPAEDGSIATIFGGTTPGMTQEFGQTPFSLANCGMYAYAVNYGLAECSHTGLDYGAAYGTQMYSPVSGVVTRAGGTGYFYDTEATRWQAGKGELRIRLSNGDEVIMGHMASITVAEGQTVQPGTPVGTVGYVAGPHLHLEYRVPDGSLPYGQRIIDPRDRLAG